jgi:DNA-binding winged helix-turn-helix (wHTH) protein
MRGGGQKQQPGQIWFTVCYPVDYRMFTGGPGCHCNFRPSVDEHSLRSYNGGVPSKGQAAVRPIAVAGESARAADQPVLLFGNLEIRPAEIQALADGRRVGLTVREFQVLLVLALREDRVVRRADIYAQVWSGEMKHRDRSVDVFVRKVRNKLANVAPDWAYIHTHFGVGYRFAATPLASLSSVQQAPEIRPEAEQAATA